MSDPGQRGTLTIAPKVVERVAAIAASSVAGVTTPEGSRLGQVLHRTYPRVEVEVAGDRAVLALEVAAVWPTPLPSVAADVAHTVREELGRLAGVKVDRMTVRVADVIKPTPTNRKRVQ